MESRRADQQAQDAELHARSQQNRADDAGCADQDQERGRSHTHVQEKLSRGHLWELCDEYRWSEHIGLSLYVHHAKIWARPTVLIVLWYRPHSNRHQGRDAHIPTATYIRGQGPRARLDAVLQAIQGHQAVSAARYPTPRCTYNLGPHSSTGCLTSALRVVRTVKVAKTVRNSMVCTNAFSAPAAVLPALHIGGTPKSTWDQPYCFSHTAGSPIRETRRPSRGSTI